ncbi:uncharacterized protein LOC132601343 [Lycium barbarum]|uniref:uncharacterized protein LOC132601343 n=1 Tax=Lycium barbarum TaxID=112863 RepID=UPI00293F6F74|nr:uncharacterized protein LOC132601343 [Lycium barbarum]
MENLWPYTFFDKLQVDSSSHPILLIEAPRNPKENREKQLKSCLTVPAMFLANQAALSLYPANRTTGVVVNCSDGGCYAVPIIEGYPFSPAVSQSNVTAKDLSRYLGIMINEEVPGHDKSMDRVNRLSDDIMNKYCYIALDFEKEMEMAKHNSAMVDESYELPGGNILTIASQRFRGPEILFSLESLSNHEMTYNSITKSDANIRI